MEIAKRQQSNIKKIVIILAIICLALILRLSLIEHRSGDFDHYTGRWYEFIVNNGGFNALKFPFSNHNVPYQYLLVIVYYLFPGLPTLAATKVSSILFDFIGAFVVAQLVRLKYPGFRMPTLAFAIALFTPTVVINSSAWGQSDFIYTTFLLACTYFLCKRQEIWAAIAFGLALAFKLQAMFLSPILFVLLLKRFLSWRFCLIVPITYVVMLLPAWIAGRPFKELLLIYFQQANTYDDLTKHAPNLYQWISDDYYAIFSVLGLLITAFLVVVFAAWLYRIRTQVNPNFIIRIAMISALAVPYFLPKMHERYFFVADLLSVIFAFYFPRYFFLPIVIIASSLLSYAPFMLGELFVSLKVQSLFLLAVLIFLLRELNSYLQQQSKLLEVEPQH